jgi:hypothetical protein
MNEYDDKILDFIKKLVNEPCITKFQVGEIARFFIRFRSIKNLSKPTIGKNIYNHIYAVWIAEPSHFEIWIKSNTIEWFYDDGENSANGTGEIPDDFFKYLELSFANENYNE